MCISRLLSICLSLVTAWGLAFGSTRYASAQTFPSRPITVIFPFPAGTQLEQVLRAINADAAKALGQPVILENRPGANGRLGIMAIKKSPADGHVLTMGNLSIMVTQPLSDPSFPLEVDKDYAPVAFLVEFPLVWIANPDLPFADLKGLVSYAKANPGKLNWATSPGTQFLAERLRRAMGIEVTMVPYAGATTTSHLDLMAGRVHFAIAGPDVAQFVAAGKLRGIATTGNQRWTTFPSLPTLTEAGLPMSTTNWYGYLATAGTPPEVVARLGSAFVTALKQPEILKQINGFGMTAGNFSTPSEFTSFIRAEVNAWGPVIRDSGIKFQ